MIEDQVLKNLEIILEKHQKERVCVVGTTCTGKSTLLKQLPYALDMDELIFPLLSTDEKRYVCQSPWTKEIGETMTRLVKEKIKISPGKPVFSTVVLDSDYIVYLKISDSLLKERTDKRGHSYEDAKKMQRQIEEEIVKSQIPYEEVLIS